MLKPSLLVTAALLALAGCGGAEGRPGGPSSERLTLRPAGTVAGAPLGYREYLPPGYGDGEPRPLLVFLHSRGGSGDGSEAALAEPSEGVSLLVETDAWPEDRSFVVLAPQYGFEAAMQCLLADEIDSFLRFAIDYYDVDETRVYVTGISCGAVGTWDYLAEHGGETVAAVLPIAGHTAGAFDRAGCELARVPIWAFHGADDPIVPPTDTADAIRQLETCTGPDVRLTVYPEAIHSVWTRTYDLSAGHDVYAWLLEHKR